MEQCVCTSNDKEEGMRDPIAQVRKHTRLLSQWLIDNLGTIPIEYLVVIAQSSTVIKTIGISKDKKRRLLHS